MSYAKEIIVKEWLKSHQLGNGWEPIMAMEGKTKELPVIVLMNKSAKLPFSVQYAGNGKYFLTLEEAEKYVRSRFGEGLLVISADDLKKL